MRNRNILRRTLRRPEVPALCSMAVGGSTAEDGESEVGVNADAEGQLLERELHEVECVLTGEVQQIGRLAQENERKVEELRGLKEDVKTLQERNDYHVLMLQDEHASAQQEIAHRLAVLREQATQLGLKHERYKVVAHLNETAAAQVESLLFKMEQRTKTHGEEVHAIRQEVLHLRQQLESTFRKTLKDLGGTYRRKAFEALANDAKAGWRANKVLRQEMALQEVGVIALGERHVEQRKKGGEYAGQLERLRNSKAKQKTALSGLHRETRANICYFADIQETKKRISEAERGLRRELENQGVPSCSLSEVREMALKEREERKKLNKLNRRWRRRSKEVMRAIFPSTSNSRFDVQSLPTSSCTASTSTSDSTRSSHCGTSQRHFGTTSLISGESVRQPRALRGSKSAPPSTGFPVQGHAGAMGVETGWQARVGRVTDRWDRVDGFSSPNDLKISSASARILGSVEGGLKGEGRQAHRNGKRSASTSALERGNLASGSKPVGNIHLRSPATVSINSNAEGEMVPRNARNQTSIPVERSRSNSMERLHFRSIVEEDPWEKKRRMERAVRRRDAGIRAKGLAVNNSRNTCFSGKD